MTEADSTWTLLVNRKVEMKRVQKPPLMNQSSMFEGQTENRERNKEIAITLPFFSRLSADPSSH